MLSQLLIQNLTSYSHDHFSNGRFFDNLGDPTPSRPKPSLKILLGFLFSPHPDVTKDSKAPFHMINSLEFNQESGIRFWWLGHATCLFQIGETFIISDPVFSKYASPVPLIIKRAVPPPISIDQLPPISYIIISHDHYDHLDYSTMRELNKRFPNATVITGLGIDTLVRKWGMKSIGLDWRQKITTPEKITFTCMPARHYTNRYGYDRCRRLWSSWIIEYKNTTFYFPGDTAYGPHFKEIHDYLGHPIDLVPIPIGPGEPAQMMRAVHLDAVQAYQACKDLHAVRAVPIHWGVFPLGFKGNVSDIDVVRNVWDDGSLRKVKVGGSLEWNGEKFEEPTNADSLFD